jgi:mRNA interferase RelE/StbE
LRIEWHEDAVKDLRRLGRPAQRRIRIFLDRLRSLDDPRIRAEPYKGQLRGYWKLRVGAYRLVCEIETGAEHASVFIVLVAHRSVAYEPRSVEATIKRGGASSRRRRD